MCAHAHPQWRSNTPTHTTIVSTSIQRYIIYWQNTSCGACCAYIFMLKPSSVVERCARECIAAVGVCAMAEQHSHHLPQSQFVPFNTSRVLYHTLNCFVDNRLSLFLSTKDFFYAPPAVHSKLRSVKLHYLGLVCPRIFRHTSLPILPLPPATSQTAA